MCVGLCVVFDLHRELSRLMEVKIPANSSVCSDEIGKKDPSTLILPERKRKSETMVSDDGEQGVGEFRGEGMADIVRWCKEVRVKENLWECLAVTGVALSWVLGCRVVF